jgi:hypothetical protein
MGEGPREGIIARRFRPRRTRRFDGNGVYSDPEFSWLSDSSFRPAAIAVLFYNSNKWANNMKMICSWEMLEAISIILKLDRDRMNLLLNGMLEESSE